MAGKAERDEYCGRWRRRCAWLGKTPNNLSGSLPATALAVS